jgi:hypothetical protein
VPLPGPHLKEAEGSQPAGATLFILTAEDMKALVAISQLVRLKERKWAGLMSALRTRCLCLVSMGQSRTHRIMQSAGTGVWVPTMELRSPR